VSAQQEQSVQLRQEFRERLSGIKDEKKKLVVENVERM
jgi:hypothetical protein